MTTLSGPPPKILLAVGAPDGMPGAEAAQLFSGQGIPGVSGLTSALVPALRDRSHPCAVIGVWPGSNVGPDAARALLEGAGGRVLVNAICEPQQQRSSLERLARLELELRLPIVNPSWVVRSTTRPAIARRLSHQAAVRVPRCSLYLDGALTLSEHIDLHEHRFPVLLRPPGEHGSVGLLRINRRRELATKAHAVRSCTVTDFVDFRSEDGLWRKYRIVCAGDRLFRRHVLAHRKWNITRDARTYMGKHPHLVAEEEEWIGRPVTLEPGSVEARVLHQFRALQLDFGVIDFALPPGGDIVIFEINACVQITNHESEQDPSTRRHVEANNIRIIDALVALINARAAASA